MSDVLHHKHLASEGQAPTPRARPLIPPPVPSTTLDMHPSREVLTRCAICDASLRSARRIRLRGVPVATCLSCGHSHVERLAEPGNLSQPNTVAASWTAFEKAADRLLALRTLGYDDGRLLDVGEDETFGHVASAGPFEVTSVRPNGHGPLIHALPTVGSTARFRVVTLWSGLDREVNPLQLLEGLRERLQPGGMLATAVGIVDPSTSGEPDPLGPTWHFFSRTSLRVGLLRAGFDIKRMMPADLRHDGRLRIHERLTARTATSLLGFLSRQRPHSPSSVPEPLWRLARTAELWATRP